MQKFKPPYLWAVVLLLTSASCQKVMTTKNSPSQDSTGGPSTRPSPGKLDSISHPPSDTGNTILPPLPVSTPLGGCSVDPIYGDTIIFPQPTANGQDYIVYPVNSPGTGKYFAWPQGMVIDPNTGAINLTKSETGMLYAIGFVKDGTTDTCLQRLVVGGAAYMDSVYVLASGADAAAPYFEANPYLPSICQGNGCTFDVTGSAAQKKVIVDQTTGIIDLKKTLNGTGLLGGAFGLLPISGSSVTADIYYKLNDPSNQALQHIAVQIEYYDSKALISGGLLGAILNKVNNLTSGNLISNYANPRPPLIIIVRR
ncbi:MAG TPA: hypothetical protein VHD83_27725 [Puia sp.]|nr:hypothetical protein [Puia sp.]